MRLFVFLVATVIACGAPSASPNVILCMADDMGWGDAGYQGHPFLQTPNLDAMAANGLRFDRWYAASPVCSPTRGSVLTGRHPERYGIHGANDGKLPAREQTIAEALKPLGYATGFFGKWHLGTLTTTVRDSNRGGRTGDEFYTLPTEHGFDTYFATEAKVPTFDPMVTPTGWGDGNAAGTPFGTYYWEGPDQRVTENLEGDDSRVIMDRAIPFIRETVNNDKPFFAVIWFHAPHLPIVAGERHRAPYADLEYEGQHYFGCITALDEQMGRLRSTLRELGVAEDTMLWFCSDNGPEDGEKTPNNGSAGPFRGRKRDVLEGGVRVPGLLEWPTRIPGARATPIPASTLDYLPTILDVVGAAPSPAGPLDGVSLLPLITDAMEERPKPIPFRFKARRALSDNRFKIHSEDNGASFALYDLIADPGETQDVSLEYPEVFEKMKSTFAEWEATLDH